MPRRQESAGAPPITICCDEIAFIATDDRFNRERGVLIEDPLDADAVGRSKQERDAVVLGGWGERSSIQGGSWAEGESGSDKGLRSEAGKFGPVEVADESIPVTRLRDRGYGEEFVAIVLADSAAA